MSLGPENRNPEDPNLKNDKQPGKIEALNKLVLHFRNPEFNSRQKEEASEKLFHILRRYRMLSYFAQLDGLSEKERKKSVKNGLIEERLLDISDSEKTDEEFEIISNGYELNKKLWDCRLDLFERDEK
jgi:hypothetical protein